MTEMAFRGAAPRRAGSSALEDWWHNIDRWSLGAVLALTALGVVLALAASPPLAAKNGLGTYHYVTRHLVFAAAGFGLAILISTATLRSLRRIGVLLFLGSFLAIALLPWLGTDFGKGAVRWYSLGFASLQPSEILKPAFVIAAAWVMAGSQDPHGPPGRLIAGLGAALIAGLLALQPDFGQAMLIVAIYTAMFFVSGANVLVLVGLAAVVVGAGAYAYVHSAHFAGRIDGYLAGTVDPNTQLAYAMAAIREGGMFGVGAAQGSVKWTLPDAHTDFIVAVAAEEFGLLFVLGLVGLYLFLCLRALTRLIEVSDPFLRLAGTGLAVMIGLQAFVNFGVAIRLLPAKGMTLPFVSYGGSSMLAAGFAMGALLAITRTRPLDPAAVLRSRL
ncbi:putative lipid II flippase FtsW [Paralimibaculum aggregatum]|uniref:Probable peptidoglycan glycosyltransferase FtsW n=1 Tax=Paralimibaculum aggregatum TaxID=3036245 RepID=A0ABQ6LNE1_9RHOB|nr:FtsW/RodA/SpoVE family cell cycle protein [Limibaculum sp. NKW23]GMG82343.1 putative lipid II flippase FtsW [Limibaculum sp. NKW23]